MIDNCENDEEFPHVENIHARLLEAISEYDSELDMNAWHRCETTHCRAGWAVHLAGDAGYLLEDRVGTLFAAMQIYRVSGYKISPVRFFESAKLAMQDIERLANC